MSKPTCSASSLLETAKCLKLNVLSPKQLRALSIHCKVLELATIGGTDYTNQLTNLTTDAAQFACGMEISDRQAITIALDCVNAQTAGAAYPTDLVPVHCLALADDKTLDEIDLMLKCKLGAHATQR